MKKVIIAIDSFKGSLSSWEAGCAVREAVREVYPDAESYVYPMADGGEGTVDALVHATGEKLIEATVTGPLGEPVRAAYGILPDGTAVIEMAAAAGLTLVPTERRDPLLTDTYGVGELILHAVGEGCRNFIIGLGGSATNDGGVGMLRALGVAFTDADGKEIPRGAKGLSVLQSIDVSALASVLHSCNFTVACDVTNPLCGARGCSAVYGPQKGATSASVCQMDADLARYAELTAAVTGKSMAESAGAGAAGGLGFAFLSYLDGKFESGISLVMRAAGIEARIAEADLVITGEGRMDGQSFMGKAPVGVARIAKRHAKPVIAFCGAASPDAHLCRGYGIDAVFPILRAPCSLEAAMESGNAYKNLKATAVEVLCLCRAMPGN